MRLFHRWKYLQSVQYYDTVVSPLSFNGRSLKIASAGQERKKNIVGHGTSRNISDYRRHFSEIFLLFRKKWFRVLILGILKCPFLLGRSSQKMKKSAWDSGT